MNGQPQVVGVIKFDCTDLTLNAPGMPPGNIIRTNEPLQVSASFQGSGFVWDWLKPPANNPGAPWHIEYYAESIGPGSNDVRLGTVNGNLTAGDTYTAPVTTLNLPPGTLQPGVYRLACVITFPNNHGMTGFYEGQVVEVFA